MAWRFNNNAPIYIQIMDEIRLRIARGELSPGDKVPPVRDLALKAGVNPNTMQKALSELEREGVLYSERTAGRFVSDVTNGENHYRDKICNNITLNYVNSMRELGIDGDELVDVLKNFLIKEGKTDE